MSKKEEIETRQTKKRPKTKQAYDFTTSMT